MRLLSLSINVSFTPHTVMAQTDMAHKQPIRTRLPPIFPANPVTPPCTHTPLVLCAHSACGLAAGVCSLKHIEIPTLSGVQGSHSIASELSLTFRAECGMQKLSVRSSRRSALFLFILVAAGIDSRARVTSLPPPTPHPQTVRPRMRTSGFDFGRDKLLPNFAAEESRLPGMTCAAAAVPREHLETLLRRLALVYSTR